MKRKGHHGARNYLNMIMQIVGKMLHVLRSKRKDLNLENKAQTLQMLRSGFLSVGTKKVMIFMTSNIVNGSKSFIQKITKDPNLENKMQTFQMLRL